MPHQSTTQPRGSEKTTGPQTREQQKAIAEKRENTKGADVSPEQTSLSEAREIQEQPAGEFEITSGERSIQHGGKDRDGQHKTRSD